MAEETPAADNDDPPIALIAAVAANGVIGDDGEMPWQLPADLQHFKETTMGNPVIMGRRTYESIAARIDGPLPGRHNIVLSRSEPDLDEGVVVADSIDAAVAEAEAVCALADGAERIFVIGGATVYEQFLARADELVLTELADAYEGDTEFPEWDDSEWVAVDRDDREDFAFVTYRRQ
ncbi:dihydrofolate reductase [Halonotius sp. GCM10025705]|uniref:dihydrofolate reductase n=1 Tax=Halonotius sp. GCM10025705 TaxID=3252678 RepID=UPI003611ED43